MRNRCDIVYLRYLHIDRVFTIICKAYSEPKKPVVMREFAIEAP